MSTQILIAAGAAFLFAGVAQAAMPEAQQDREQIAIHQEAAAPKAGHDANADAATRVADESVQELHPDARPVYLNGGHFGSGE